MKKKTTPGQQSSKSKITGTNKNETITIPEGIYRIAGHVKGQFNGTVAFLVRPGEEYTLNFDPSTKDRIIRGPLTFTKVHSGG